MAQTPMTITGPLEAHGVRSADDYLAKQRQHLRALRAARPDCFAKTDPHEAGSGAVPYISGGRWVMRCACGNAPSVSVAWDLACCFECGAIYRQLAIPADYQALERALLKRPHARNRQWAVPETLRDLLRENDEHQIVLDADEAATLAAGTEVGA